MGNERLSSVESVSAILENASMALEAPNARASHEVTNLVHRTLQALVEAGADESVTLMWTYEIRLWMAIPNFFLVQAEPSEKLPPLSNRWGTLIQEYDVFPPEADEHFKKRFQESRNPYLRANYADFLAVRSASSKDDGDAARKWSLEAVNLFLESVEYLVESSDFIHQLETARVLDSAGYLALAKARGLLPKVIETIQKMLESKADEVTKSASGSPMSYGRWALELGAIMVAIAERDESAIPIENLDWWQATARRLAQLNQGLEESVLEQNFWIQVARIAAVRGRKDEQFAALSECGEAKVREAKARAEGEGASALAAATLMERAVEYMDSLRSYATSDIQRKKLADRQTQLKHEIRQLYISGSAELKVTQLPFEVSSEQIESAIAPFIEPPDLKNCLQRLGSSLLPNIELAERWANSRINDDSLSSLFSTSLIGDGLEIRSYNSESEMAEYYRNYNYEFQFHLNNKILLPQIWDKLREQKALDATALLTYLDGTRLLSERNRPLVQMGIEFYFNENFPAALHLLVPQLEDVIRSLFERAGLPSIKQSRGSNGWEFESFGGFMRRINKVSPGILPDMVSVYVERILSDPTGWNLRNRIAHGLISRGECNRFTVETVLHIYLVFALFEESPKTKETHVADYPS